MRIIIVPEDNMVNIDGVSRTVYFDYPENIRAVQWYNDHGYVEQHNGGQKYIDNIDEFEGILRAFHSLDPIPLSSEELYKRDALSQIAALEAQVTQRRLREAVLTPEGSDWLETIESQIATLRATL